MKELEIQTGVIDYLKAVGVFHYRQNAGAFMRDEHFYRMGANGCPDIICIIAGRYVGIEIKTPTGKLSEN